MPDVTQPNATRLGAQNVTPFWGVSLPHSVFPSLINALVVRLKCSALFYIDLDVHLLSQTVRSLSSGTVLICLFTLSSFLKKISWTRKCCYGAIVPFSSPPPPPPFVTSIHPPQKKNVEGSRPPPTPWSNFNPPHLTIPIQQAYPS